MSATEPTAPDLRPAPPTPIQDSLRRTLDEAQARRPPDARGRVRVEASLQGVEASAAIRLRAGWELGVWGAYDRQRGLGTGVRLDGVF